MTDWRDRIIEKFIPRAHRIYVASDPDGLLVETEINQQVRDKGFDVLPFEDSIAFRHTYETKYRRNWTGEDGQSGLIVRTESRGFSSVPYDVLTNGKSVELRLSNVFPGLYVPVVRQLNPTDWDDLYQAVEANKPGELNAAETKSFVLHYVFHIDPAVIEDESSLLHFLLRRHYGKRRVPPELEEYLITQLSEKGGFEEWPLDQIVPNATDFYSFLQERWPFFLEQEGIEFTASEPPSTSQLAYDGPVHLSFEDPDVKSYVDSLFIDRLLNPVTLPGTSVEEKRWLRVGIQIDEDADRRYRFDRLASKLQANLPGADADHFAWTQFAKKWAELSVLRHRIGHDVEAKYHDLRNCLDEQFAKWMYRRYGGLYNQPPPVMVHHVPRFMARQLNEGAERVAVLVIDGLALDQWVVLRNCLKQKREEWRFDESAIFAWVPTLTDVSRQAIFAGKMPQDFPTQLGGTPGEEALWTQFWKDQPSTQESAYLKVEGQRDDVPDIETSVRAPMTSALGLVFYQVDEIMHGMTMGTAGMHRAVEEWVEYGALLPTLSVLQEEGYRTFITSDHGNIEATGAGQPREGSTVDNRGRRARVYEAENLRTSVAEDYSESIEWPSIGLPNNYYPLLSSGRSMFDRDGNSAVVHGGASLEEVVVPFIEVR